MTFYETTPMGAVMNRYSEDVAEIDFVVPFTVRSMVNSVLKALGDFGVIIVTTPLALIGILVVCPAYFFSQVKDL